MNFDEFVAAVKEQLKLNFGEETEININSVRKNNGVVLTGIVIMEKDSHIAPTIYMEGLYHAYKHGMQLQQVCDEIMEINQNSKVSCDEELTFYHDFEQVKKKIYYKLVNAQKNESLLEDVPFIRFLDLAILFCCDCSGPQFGNAAILIKNEHLKMWNVTVKELYREAIVNTPVQNPFEIKTMQEIIKELFEADIRKEMQENHISFSESWVEEMAMHMLEEESAADCTPMYVLTNTHRTHGAACILYADVLKDFAQALNDNLYILPSSIHEIIMVPASLAGKASQLREMVVEINATQVQEEEVLSDSVYFFDRFTGKVEIA